MICYAKIENKKADAILGNSKARQARVLFDFAREFKGIFPSATIEMLTNEASKIICGNTVVAPGALDSSFKIPTDEVEHFQKKGLAGQILTIKILR
jgi:hypothetical protein